MFIISAWFSCNGVEAVKIVSRGSGRSAAEAARVAACMHRFDEQHVSGFLLLGCSCFCSSTCVCACRHWPSGLLNIKTNDCFLNVGRRSPGAAFHSVFASVSVVLGEAVV